MKTTSIHVLYRLSAFLADKTNGASLFSKWKIALGGLLLSATIASCQKTGKETTPTIDKDSLKKDSVKPVKGNKIDSITITPTDPPENRNKVSCYMVIPPPKEEDSNVADTIKTQE